jgi:2-iminobutanoate/2-iminopropanoate deaminase
MSVTVIQTEQAPAAIGPYSQGIRAGGWLYVSGQIGLNPASGELVGNDFAGQAQQVLDNLSRVVEAAGLALTDVVAVDVFITDMARFAAFNQIYERHFSPHRPARAVVEVSALPRGALVEVKCVAYRP